MNDNVRELNEEYFLVEVFYVSIDPAIRGWIIAVCNYSEPVAFDQPIRSFDFSKIISNKKFILSSGVSFWLSWFVKVMN